AFEPVICYSLSAGIYRLREVITTFSRRCIEGITANEELLRAEVSNSIGLVTALNPYIGYEAASTVAKEALESGRGVAELVLEKGLLPADQLEEVLRPEVLAQIRSRSTTRV